jgi:hypothetical protein
VRKNSPLYRKGSVLDGWETSSDSFLEQTKLTDLMFEKARPLIGRGSYGDVQLALHMQSGVNLAVKKVLKSKIEQEKLIVPLRREIDI